MGINISTQTYKKLICNTLFKMKLTIFSIVAALCVVLVSSHAGDTALPLPFEPDTSIAGIVDVENFTIFSKFYWVARAALKNLKRVNCSIKEVVKIKATCEDFLSWLQGCGNDALNGYKNVITSVKSVIATCDKIINLNDKVCNNANYDNEKGATTWKCFFKLLGQMNTLNKNIKNTMKAIKKVPELPKEAAVCANDSVKQLTNAFTSFPANVELCSKLTSK